jgi:hypothetical protein
MKKMIVLILALMAFSTAQQPVGVPGYARGEVLFRDAFDSPDSLKRWTNYGDARFVNAVTSFANNNGTYGVSNGSLYFDDPGSKPDNHMWTPVTFDGDFGISFDIEPRLPNEGGCILSYCALPLDSGGSLSGSGSGEMDSYYGTIACYHFSFAVSNMDGTLRNTSHLRKCGPGLWMCSQVNVDPCAKRDSAYHVEIYKIGDHHFLYVDGKPVIHYLDNGAIGDSIYHKGYVGIRNWTGFQAYYDNFEVFRIVSSARMEGKTPRPAKPDLRIAPNPARRGARLFIPSDPLGRGLVEVFDVKGRLVLRERNDGSGLHPPEDAGLFLVRLTAEQASVTDRIIIVK